MTTDKLPKPPRRWEREPIECPLCGGTEDMWIRGRADGGLDYKCHACGDRGILDIDQSAHDGGDSK